MRKLSQIYLMLTLTLFFAGKSLASGNRETREVAMAENAIFWSLVASANSASRTACSLNQFACSDDRAELGLSLLGAKNSPEAIRALTGLLRYRIDGALSEDFACYILMKRNITQKSLQQIESKEMHEKCEREVTLHAAQQPELFKGVDVSQICTSGADLDAKRLELIAQISKGKRCAQADF